MIDGLNSLSRLKSVSYILNQNGGTFFHCPFVVENECNFKKEFANSPLAGEYYYTKACFVPIPEQLKRIGEEYRIGFYNGDKLEKTLRQLYLLHPKY